SGGTGHLRAVVTGSLLLRLAPVRRSFGDRSSGADRRDHRGLLPLLCRTLRVDARFADLQFLAHTGACWRPQRIVDIPMTPSPPEVEIVDFSKQFGTVQALDAVSVRFTAGRMHALLGENGAGKSTLVKCLMGYYQGDAGRILVDRQARAIAHPYD